MCCRRHTTGRTPGIFWWIGRVAGTLHRWQHVGGQSPTHCNTIALLGYVVYRREFLYRGHYRYLCHVATIHGASTRLERESIYPRVHDLPHSIVCVAQPDCTGSVEKPIGRIDGGLHPSAKQSRVFLRPRESTDRRRTRVVDEFGHSAPFGSLQ